MKKLIIILMLPFVFSAILAQNSENNPSPKVLYPNQFAISSSLRDIGPTPTQSMDTIERNPEFKKKIPPNKGTALPNGPDPVWQKEMGTSNIKWNPTTNFEGIANGDVGGTYGVPPDTQGDVGPDNYFQVVNTSYQIWDKQGNSLVGPLSLSSIWSAYNPGPLSDPIVLYDEIADRWFLSIFEINSPYRVLIAVSTTPDPTGSFYLWSYAWAGQPDYAKYGIWRDGYYFGYNNGTCTYDVGVFDRSAMLAGNANPAVVAFDNPHPTFGNCILPFDNDGGFALSGTSGQFIHFYDDAWPASSTDQLWIYSLNVNWISPAFSTFSRTQTINVTPFDSNMGPYTVGVSQPGTTQKLSTVSNQMMYRAQYRKFDTHETIICSHTVDVDNTDHAGIRWYELRRAGGNWWVYQESTYAPDAASRFMCSIAMNTNGDMALGYSVASSSVYPSIRYTGRKVSDPLNTMTIPEGEIFKGLQSQTGSDRWGDYTCMSVDPTDNVSFWYTNEYSNGGQNWKTRIAKINFDNPVYCLASGGCDEFISRVQMGTIDNSSGCSGYADYTTMSTSFPANGSQQIIVTNGPPNYGTDECGIWVDWNQDGDFYSANEQINVNGNPGTGPYTATISPPYGAPLGYYTVRIRIKYYSGLDPCGTTTYGEVEDYTINLTPKLSAYWTGALNTDWHNADNWSSSSYPDATTDVIIPETTNKCWVYATDAECNNLTINHGTGANFLKVFDEDLHIYGDLIINGQLILDHPSGKLIVEGNVSWESGSTAYFPYYDEFLVYGDWHFKNGANAQINNGTIEFVGSGGNYIYSDDTDCYFNNITSNKTGGGWLSISNSSSQDLNIRSDLYIQPNCLLYCSNLNSVILQGDLNNFGTLQCNHGTFVFDGNQQAIFQSIPFSASTTFNNLTISSTNSISIWYNDIYVNNHVTIKSGYIATDKTIHVGGNWDNQTGSPGLYAGMGTVEFNGGNYDQYCSSETFYVLGMNKTAGGILKIADSQVDCSIYDWTAGGIDVNSGGSFTANDLLDDGIFGTYYLSSGGTINLTNNDGCIDLNGELNISGGTMNIYGGTSLSFWPYLDNAHISMSDGILDFHDQGIIIYDATPYHLTENITGGTIRTAGSFYGETNEFTPDYGTFEFYGSIDEYISTENGCYLNNVVINKSNELSIVGGLLDINGNLVINSGVLNTMGYDIQIEGDWTNNVGDAGFIESTGWVLFNGEGSVATIYTNEIFNNLIHSNAGGGIYGLTLTAGININVMHDLELHWSALEMDFGSTLYVGGDLYIAQGAGLNADDGDNIIAIGGNWTNENSTNSTYYGFYPGGETVLFNGLEFSDQILSTYATKEEFTNVIINNGGVNFRPDNNIQINGELLIITGNWLDNVAGLTHYFCGNFTIGSSGNYYPEGITVFAGTSDQYYQTNGGSGYFKNIIVDKSSKGEQGKGAKNMTLTLNSDMVVFNGNTTTIEEGIFNLNGKGFKSTGDININDGGGIIVDAGASLSIVSGLYVNNGGLFTASGLSGNKANIWKDGAGNYSFEVNNGGTISAEHAVFEKMDYNGVYLLPGASVDPAHSFDNCTFQDGVSGGNMFTVSNNQDFTVEDAVFMSYYWVEDYNVNKNSTSGNVTFINATGNFAGEAFEYDPNNLVHWGAPEIELELTVFFEGPFNGATMNTGLNDLSLLPLNQPYNTPPWNYGGTESVPSIPNADVVDWVLIELRDTTYASLATGETMIARQAAFLLNDGSIVGLDGTDNACVVSTTITNNLFVVIWHRNHLGIMSANPVTESGGIYTYNFTTPAGQAYGTNAQKNLTGGVYGMFGGDANADGDVNTDDKIIWANDAGTYGYKSSDFNMDGQTENQDKNDIWQQNTGESSQLPPAMWQCGDDLNDTRDGQTYVTIQIGTQCWMAENLNIGTMVNGTTTQTDNSTIEKYCYSNSTSNCDTYGGLYQWDEMMQYTTTPGVQGICPSGWHLPTDSEWCTLENEVDAGTVSCSAIGWRGTDVGGNLKETGTTHWHHPNIGATNSSGFTARGSGYRNNGVFYNLTYSAYLWSSNMTGTGACYRGFWHGYAEVNRYYNSKAFGSSVRCLQD